MSGRGPSAGEMMGALQQAGYRMTSARRAVVDEIASRTRPFSSTDILDKVLAADGGIGRATVFRTLDVLLGIGMLGRIQLADGAFGYVVCMQEHHHHAICSGCGLVVDLPGCVIDSESESQAIAAGFLLKSHRLEYYGLCGECQSRGIG
jgi:Fe2+ or Zn2+ uptake regulation protein